MDVWEWLGFGLLTSAIIVIFGAIGITTFSKHNLHDYYMRSSSFNGSVTYQIYNDVDYAVDTVAYITTDEDKAVATLERLKGTLHGK